MTTGVNVYRLLMSILIVLGHFGTCAGQKEITGLGVAEYFSVSPEGHFLLALKRTNEFSSEGPFTFELRVNRVGRTDPIMQDTIADTYADGYHFFWVNDSLLFASEKGVFNVYSGRYDAVRIPRVLEYVNYDDVNKTTIYITADKRGEVLNSIKANKVKALLVLKRAAFESEGQPAVTLQWDRSKTYSYVLEYSEDSLEITRINFSGPVVSPWQRIGYHANRMYDLVIADDMCCILSKKDRLLSLYRSGMSGSLMLTKGVSSIFAVRDTLFFIDSTGLRTILTDGRTELLLEKASLPGQTIEGVTRTAFYISSPGKDVYEHNIYRGRSIHLYSIDRPSVVAK